MAGEAQVMAMAKNVGDGTSAFTELTRIDGPPDLLTTIALEHRTFTAARDRCARWTEPAPSAMRPLTTTLTLTAVTTAKPHALAQKPHQAASIDLAETLTHRLGDPRTVERSTRVFTTHAVSRSSPGCERDIAELGLDVLFTDERWSTQVDHARTDEPSIRSRAE